MYPILYEANETEFESNGIGMLQCTKCHVTEERNGIYECEFEIPTTALHYEAIKIGRIVLAPHDETKDMQPFEIYRKSLPIDGVVTFNAHHVSYKLDNVIIPPMEYSGIVPTFVAFEEDAITANPFHFWTSKQSAGTFKTEIPAPIRSILWGTQGSILDVFGGGEFEFDKYLVKLYQHRGQDNGVTIRHGKNLSDYEHEIDATGVYNAILPYYQDEEAVVYGSTVRGNQGEPIVAVMDFSEDFEEPPTAAQLEARAAAYLEDNTPWIPPENLKIDFVALWKTEEYADVAPLERVGLCDTVTVDYMGTEVSMKVIRTEYDALLERYSEIELGEPKTSFAQSIIERAETSAKKAAEEGTAYLEDALRDAINKITGVNGGHVVIGLDASGKPQEILIMDTEDVATAQKILRMNMNGIAFSKRGIAGPYSSAWTLDGDFVANFITTGELSCDRIKGGVLTLGGGQNGDGYIVINDGNGDLIARIDKDGIIAHSLTADDFVYVYGQGGSRIYTPTNVDGVTVEEPTDPAYVDLSNKGLTTQAVMQETNLVEDATRKTIFPADGTLTYKEYREGEWVDIQAKAVISATSEEGQYKATKTNYHGMVEVKNPQGVSQGAEWMDFNNSTVQADKQESIYRNVINGDNSLRIYDMDSYHYTGEYVDEEVSPRQGYTYTLDTYENTERVVNIRPYLLSMSEHKETFTANINQGGDHEDQVISSSNNSVSVDFTTKEVSIDGDSSWALVLNGKKIRSDWEFVGYASGSNAIPYDPDEYSELYVTVLINSGSKAYVTFFIPLGAARSASSWSIVNYYGSSNNGYVRLNVNATNLTLGAAFDGTTSVTASAGVWVYGR